MGNNSTTNTKDSVGNNYGGRAISEFFLRTLIDQKMMTSISHFYVKATSPVWHRVLLIHLTGKKIRTSDAKGSTDSVW